ncbi:response regulator [Leptolyngbya iicbica LK]|uniref:Response regulator n=3 Tax=Cyanophyceae TaxID=3028117 RepID=A0A4Q7EIX4_9CYAN|nr:response regulator [Leptolyngbya sp. LK]
MALTQAGYHSVQVSSGEQVRQDFLRLQPDLVLLDAVMPDGNGFECCQQLRTEFQTEIPILMVTVLDDQDSIDRAFAAGATDYITKPIHWAVLRQRVKRLLLSYQAAQQAQDIQQQLHLAHSWESLQQAMVQGLHQHLAIHSLLANHTELYQDCFQAQQIIVLNVDHTIRWQWPNAASEPPSALHHELGKLLASLAQSASIVPHAPAQLPASGPQSAAVTAALQDLATYLNLTAVIVWPLVWEGAVLGWLLLGSHAETIGSANTLARGRQFASLLAIALGITQ